MKKAYHIAGNPLPVGYKILVEFAEVAGVHHRRENGVAFCRASGQSLDWEREPDNPHDANAIAIYGCWRTWLGPRRVKIGYVARDLAANLASASLVELLPRLHKTYLGADDYLDITYQVIGPKTSAPSVTVAKTTFESADQLRKSGQLQQAEEALVFEIARTEISARDNGWGVAPAPYLSLAKLYRARKDYQAEVAVLERYMTKPHAPGALPPQLAARLEKARALAARS